MTEDEIRLKVLNEVQAWIGTHDIYKVIWPYYDYSGLHAYGEWVPLKTERINILEVLK
jgi:hypothetical protein